jgi:hypothetical protein
VNDNPDNVLSDSEKARIRAEEDYRAKAAAEARRANGLESTNLTGMVQQIGVVLSQGSQRLTEEARKAAETARLADTPNPTSGLSDGASEQYADKSDNPTDPLFESHQKRSFLGITFVLIGIFMPASKYTGIGEDIYRENGFAGLVLIGVAVLAAWFTLQRNYVRLRQVALVAFLVNLFAIFAVFNSYSFLNDLYGSKFSTGFGWLFMLAGSSLIIYSSIFGGRKPRQKKHR